MAFGELNLNYDASTGGLFYKNSLGAVVKVGPCQVSATAPNSSPAGSSGNSAGEFWFDTATSTLKLYDGFSWVEAGGMVQGLTGSAPITVDNTDPLNPVIGIDAASTTAPGSVQLNDTTSSVSTTEALTANQGRNLQEQINALSVSSNLTLAGTLDASTGNLVTVTTEGTAQGFTVGNPLPSPASGNAEFFVIATTGAVSYTPPGGSPTEVHVGDWFLSSGTVWNFLDVGFQAAYATTTVAGVVQLATDAEVQDGVNLDHAIVPSALQSKLSDSVTTTSSTTIASSTAAKDAYDSGIQGQTDAAAAQATADAAMPKTGGTFTGDVTVDNLAVLRVEGVSYFGAETFFQSGSTPTFESGSDTSFQGNASFSPSSVTQFVSGSTITGVVTFDGGTTINSNAVSNFDNQLNLLPGGTSSIGGAQTFISGSTLDFDAGSSVTVDGTFTFNTAPVFPAGVDIGAAVQVTYDNVTSGLAATDVQGAIDEIVAEYVPNASFTAAGDLLVGSGSGTYAALPAGAADNILASDGAGGLIWVPQSEGDVTGVTGTSPITVDNTDPQNPVIGIDSASTTGTGAVQLSDSTSSTSITEAATANAVKTAYDAAVAAQATADAALPKAGGSMSGNITFSDAGEGVVFSDASSITGLSDSTSSSSTTVAASSAAVKAAYDAAIAAQNNGPLTSDTVLYVNSTDGNDSTAVRGTDKPFATITAALAAATDGDTIFLSAGTFTEDVTISKGVHLAGTYCDQATWSGTKILGSAVVNLTGGVTRNLAISDIYFISATATSPFSVTGVSPGAGGINTITGCMFTQATVTDPAQFAFQTSGTWTRSLYLRECTIDGNFKHNAGTAAGANGYVVVDRLLGVGNSSMYHSVLTGTVEYRNPSNSLAAILQTGGVVLVNGASSGITSNGAVTTALFGGTGFSYKGTAASVGTGTIYFSGGSNQAPGKVDIGANLVYGWTNLTIDAANLTVNVAAVAYTTAVPAAANTVAVTQQRPRLDLLKSTSSVSAANQLATVVDSSTGALYTVSSMDAGTF